MDQVKIGKFIAECRKNNNLTQMQLAEKLNITDRAVSKWETGKSMPDSGVMLDLCKELKISVNELLSGEKIKKEDEQDNFEKNILSTLDYSKNKIKHTKLAFEIIFTLMIILISFLLIAFEIDIYRMKNNKPVIFSTWGFEYVPPINLDQMGMENAIKDYLIEEGEKSKHHDEEKTFVAMRTYLISEQNDRYYVYAWVLQENYYKENDTIQQESGSSIPYMFEIDKVNDNFVVIDYEIPKDGSYYAKDMKHIFPNSVLSDMDKIYTDGTIEKLENEIQRQVTLVYIQK